MTLNKKKGKPVFVTEGKVERSAELIIANKEIAFQHLEKEKRADELIIANNELAFQNKEKEKRAAELVIANKELAYQNHEKEQRAAELIIANKELAFQNEKKEKRAVELSIANRELSFQNKEKEKRAAELSLANIELVFQNEEKEKRAAELNIANIELVYQNEEKEKRATELSTANKELAFQNKEKEKRAAELKIANIELAFQNDEKEKRAAELGIANEELAFQNEEKEKRATEVSAAIKELAFQNKEKEKRAAELIIANIELAFQNDEKEKRAAELKIANEELAFQNEEKEKRAAELVIANRELAFQNEEKEKRAAELSVLNTDLSFKYEERLKEVSDYKYSLDESSILAITDQKGVIKYVNDNFCKISKYSNDELIGQDHRIINSGHHPKEFIKNLWKTIASGKVWKGEVKNKAKDGSVYWVDTTIVPFLDEHKKPFQYVAIRSDITERKKAEEEVIKMYREKESVLNRISDGVVSVDNDWKYTFLNEAALSTHPQSKEETIGRLIWDVHPEMKGTIFWDKYHEAMLTRKVVEIESFYQPMKIWFSVKVYPSSNGLTIFYKNVTDSKKTEETILELNEGLEKKIKERTEQLESANKEMESFSYSVAHDLRSPIRAMHGYATMLEEDYHERLDEEGKRLISEITYNAKAMGTLIDDLLTFSRLGRKEITTAAIDMNQLFETSLSDLKVTGVQIPKVILKKLIPISADFSLMKHVVNNLLSNAIKYSSKKENPVIEIKSVKENQNIVYSVKDNGVGFDMAFADNLFGVFQRLHSDEEFEGTGVGLAIVQRIIHRHGGKVWSEAKENEGATFYFSLPVIN